MPVFVALFAVHLWQLGQKSTVAINPVCRRRGHKTSKACCLCSNQWHIIRQQNCIYFKHVVSTVRDKIFHNNIKPAGMGQRNPCSFQQLMISSLIAGTDCVHHAPARQAIVARDFRLTNLAAARQRRIRRIDDGVNRQRCGITSDNLQRNSCSLPSACHHPESH